MSDGPEIVGFALGDAREAEARRDEIERGKRQGGRLRPEVERLARAAGERQAAGVDGEGEIAEFDAVVEDEARGPGERDPLSVTLGGEVREIEANRRPAEQASARLERQTTRDAADVEVAIIGAGRRRQLHVGDRLTGDGGAGEPGGPGDRPRAPEIGDGDVDLEPFQPVVADAHPVAVGDDRDRLPAVAARSGDFRLKRPAEPHEHERRKIVEVLCAEGHVAGDDAIGADGERAAEAGRGETQGQIVEGPSAVGALGEIARTAQRLAVDVARQLRARFEGAGDVDRPGGQRHARRPAVEQPSRAERRLHLGAEIVRRAGEAGDELNLALHARIERLRLRDVDRRADVRLALPVVAVEPRRGVAADGFEVGEAEAAAGSRAHAAGHREVAADRPVEDRIRRDEFGRRARRWRR